MKNNLAIAQSDLQRQKLEISLENNFEKIKRMLKTTSLNY